MTTPGGLGEVLRLLLDSTGMTQGELAAALGSSPRYLRQIMAGTKTGAKYERPARELLERGYTSPAAPRVNKRGELAKVRAPGGGSRVPVERARAAAQARTTALRAGGASMVTVDVQPYPWAVPNPRRTELYDEREQDRAELLSVIRRAAQGRRQVAFQIGWGQDKGDPLWFDDRYTHGYSASAVLRQMRGEGDDPLAWLGDVEPESLPGEPWSDERARAEQAQTQRAAAELRRAKDAATSTKYAVPGDTGEDEWFGIVQVSVLMFARKRKQRA